MMGIFEDAVTLVNIKSMLLAIGIFLALLRWRKKSFNKNMPPHAYSVPLLGSLPFLGKDIREGLMKLSSKYGDVVSVQLGSRSMVVLNNYNAIKEAFVKHGHSFSGRPQDIWFIAKITKGLGIVSSEGDIWQEQRKFVHNILRNMGVGKSIFEDRIKEEIAHLMKEFQIESKRSQDPRHILQMTVSNVINAITFGQRYEYTNPKFVRYIAIMEENFAMLGAAGALNAFPWLEHVPGDWFRMKRMQNISAWMKKEFFGIIDEHKKIIQSVEAPDNLIDAYLKEIERREADGEDEKFHDTQLEAIIGDLFGAGSETTTTTLLWAIIYMIHHPEVQRKIQEEIDANIAKESSPCWKDRLNLPFTEACILETQRLADIVPLGVPHKALKDVHFMGYDIPAGTTVTSNLYSVHRDPKTWERAYDFYPEHFLAEDGSLRRREAFIPFSIGKRVCLGENLARMELFIFFTCLLQRFTFSQAEGEPMPRLDGVIAITHMPHPYRVTITPRA